MRNIATQSLQKSQFENIFREFKQPVYNFIYRYVGNSTVADDVFQDVFLKIYNNLPEYTEENKISSWIFRIAKNTLLDNFRKNRVRQTYLTDSKSLPENRKTGQENRPDVDLLNNELKGHFERSISKLSPKLKEVFLLRHEAGLSFKEISTICDLSLNAALGRMHLAVQFLKKEMNEIYSEEL